MSSLTFAAPSKGRLKEQCERYFADAGLRLEAVGGARGYAGAMPDMPGVDLQFRSASEIAAGLVAGGVHLGVTGADLVHEVADDIDRRIFMLTPLGFGRADIVVAVPNAWLDVETMADLDDVAAIHEARTGRRLRVATKYLRQTRAFFDSCGVGHYRIVESAGATEGLPAAGGAEVIVDITTTGATLVGNGLKILSDGVILRSEAWLAASLTAEWTEDALEILANMLRSLNAREAGRKLSLVEFNPDADPGNIGAAELELVGPGEGICQQTEESAVARILTERGAGPVRVSRREFIYRDENPQMDNFRSALKQITGAKV